MCGLCEETQEIVQLKIDIAGMTPTAERRIHNLKAICLEPNQTDRYKIEMIDLLERPPLTESEKVLATRAVTKELPLPIRKVIGDLPDKTQALIGLDLVKAYTEVR